MRPLPRRLATAALAAALVAAARADHDVLDPGLPAVKRDHATALDDSQGPSDHFEYDARTHRVFERDLHGTTVSVAIHEEAVARGALAPERFAKVTFAYFDLGWHVFGGFPYDRFGVRVRSPSDPEDWSLSRVGVTFTSDQYARTHPSHQGMVPHEMFHCWLGKVIRQEARGRLFELETWVTEGWTAYYETRFVGLAEGPELYTNGMRARRDLYRSRLGGPLDRTFAELAEQASADRSGPATAMLTVRGALVAHDLDAELNAAGVSLDDVLRVLYRDFGLPGVEWSQEDLRTIVSGLAGEDIAGRLDTYVQTNAEVPSSPEPAFLANTSAVVLPPTWSVRVSRPHAAVWMLEEPGDGNVGGYGLDVRHGFVRLAGELRHEGRTTSGTIRVLDADGGATLATFDLNGSRNKTPRGRTAPDRLRLRSPRGSDGALRARARPTTPLAEGFAASFASPRNALRVAGRDALALGAAAFAEHATLGAASTLTTAGADGLFLAPWKGPAVGRLEVDGATYLVTGRLRDRRITAKTPRGAPVKARLRLRR